MHYDTSSLVVIAKNYLPPPQDVTYIGPYVSAWTVTVLLFVIKFHTHGVCLCLVTVKYMQS